MSAQQTKVKALYTITSSPPGLTSCTITPDGRIKDAVWLNTNAPSAKTDSAAEVKPIQENAPVLAA